MELIKKFYKEVFILFKGNLMAQAIFFAFGLLLPLWYSPEQFGEFSVLMTMTNVFAVVATFRMDVVLMLPKKIEEVNQLFLLGIRFLLLGSLVFLLLIPLLLYLSIIPDYYTGILFFIVVGLFGFYSLMRVYFIKQNWLKQYAYWSIIFAIAVSITQGLFYYLKVEQGLVYGYLVGLLLLVPIFVRFIIRNVIFKFDRSSAISLLARYTSIIKYSFPSGVLNVIALNILPILITAIFSLKAAGVYFLANTLLNKPISVLTGSIGQNFYKTASTLHNKIELKRLSRQTFRMSALLVSVLLLGSFLAVNFILIPLYGEKWNQVIIYMYWLLPFVFAKALFSPISALAEVLDRTKVELIFSCIMLIIITIGCYFGDSHGDIMLFIKIYAIFGALAYLALIIYFTILLESSSNES